MSATALPPMRLSLALLAGILGGCGPVEQPAAPKSDEPNLIEPGLWSISRSVLSQKVGDQKMAVAIEAAPTSETKCLIAPAGRQVTLEFMLDIEGVECRPGKAEFADGKVDLSASCTPPPTHRDNILTASGDHAPERFGLTVTQASRAVPPGQDSETRLAVEGRRVGEC